MPTRSGLRLSRPIPPPTCSHCGARGHINTVCPRSSYSPVIPALTCPHCIRTVRSRQSNEPDGTQIVVTIDPCDTHSSPVVRPSPSPPHTPAAPTAPVVLPPPPPRPVVPVTSAHVPVPAPAPAPVTVPAPATVPAPVPAAAPVPAPATAPTGPVPAHYPGSSRTFTIDGEVSKYDRILARVRNGATKKEALAAEGISESFFGRKRCIAEAARIDLPSLRHGLLQLINPTLKNLLPVARDICNRNQTVLRTLHASGEALPPKRIY
ncbi:uncharacterized protein LOC134821413 [Bolinopsis microptera]|uniref:uncharacterized protein LOC134821413 n=1 Tax=Bolinopsis microptera TaxID=2820187 RepID=UPI00307A2833